MEIYQTLLQGSLLELKHAINLLRKIVKDPTYFIKRILKKEHRSKQVKDFLLSDDSHLFLNILNSPFIREYYNISDIFKKIIIEKASHREKDLYLINEFGNICFPTFEQIK